MPESMTYREFADWAKDSVEEVRQQFTDSNDDWAPVVLLERKDGAKAPMFLDFHKSLWPEAISTLVKELEVIKVAMVNSSWTLQFKSHEEREEWEADEDSLPPSEHPQGIETLLVTVYDAERTEAWAARIIRHEEKPPVLEDWTLADQAEGAMVSAISEALR